MSVIALGAMARYTSRNVRLFPVGMNYFNGHRFRSRALVEFGDPIDIPQQLVSAYSAGLPVAGSGRARRSREARLHVVDGSTAGLAVKDTIIVKVAGKDGSGAVKEKRSEVEEILSEHEALLTTPLWDAAEFEQAEESVEYTVTKTSGKAEMHQACDDLNEIIKTSLERVTVNAPGDANPELLLQSNGWMRWCRAADSTARKRARANTHQGVPPCAGASTQKATAATR